MGNDGHCGGVAEAQIARGSHPLSVLMLMPGSGLGSAFVGQDGLPLTGQTLTAMETAHMAAPLHLFGLGGEPIPCGCGKKSSLRFPFLNGLFNTLFICRSMDSLFEKAKAVKKDGDFVILFMEKGSFLQPFKKIWETKEHGPFSDWKIIRYQREEWHFHRYLPRKKVSFFIA